MLAALAINLLAFFAFKRLVRERAAHRAFISLYKFLLKVGLDILFFNLNFWDSHRPQQFLDGQVIYYELFVFLFKNRRLLER